VLQEGIYTYIYVDATARVVESKLSARTKSPGAWVVSFGTHVGQKIEENPGLEIVVARCAPAFWPAVQVEEPVENRL
jgi:hypothetical protein